MKMITALILLITFDKMKHYSYQRSLYNVYKTKHWNKNWTILMFDEFYRLNIDYVVLRY